MCLTGPLPPTQIKNKGIGWKVFKKYKGERELRGTYQGGHFPVRKNHVDKANKKLAYEGGCGGYGTYDTGFHIMDTLEDAINLKKKRDERHHSIEHVIYRVSYSKVTAYGYQELYSTTYKVVVARQMKLLRKVKV